MFRNRPEKLFLSNDTRVSGIFVLVRQAFLNFGEKRKIPIEWRPCMPIQRPEPICPVLPCTTQNKSKKKDFFPIPPDQTLYQKKQYKTSYIYCFYQTVPENALGKKIGLVGQEVRLAISTWLCQRWGAKIEDKRK